MYIFIINPTAGSGKAKQIFNRLKSTETFYKLNSKSYVTAYPGHAEQLIGNLVHKLSYEIKAIVIIGGDGTIHEVINGLGDRDIPIAYIPSGSGNDFARGAGLIDDPEKILIDLYENKQQIPYWLGHYHAKEESRFFVNCLGLGFDAAVAKRANRSRFKKICNKLHIGKLVYVMALVQELIAFKPVNMTLQVDREMHHFHRCLFISVNNHPYFGGGMKINPLAINNGDTLSILIIDSISKWKVLALFGTVFTGKHLKFKEVKVLKGKEIIISSEVPIMFQSDGETSTTNKVSISTRCKPIKVYGGPSVRISKENINPRKPANTNF